MNNKATVILAIAALAVLGLYLYKNATTVEEEPAQTHVEFVNEVYGFSFSYPDNLDVLEYTPEYISIGVGDEESFASQVDIRVAKNDAESSESFDEFVYGEARNSCAADGPIGSQSCDEVEQEKDFETDSGLTGTTFYLRQVVEDFTTDETTFGERGPFFVFNISADDAEETLTTLIVQAPTALPMDEVGADLIREVAESVRVEGVEVRQ